ncbi:hypothetical protein [Streptomyces piniterrae]|uniref:hypothetical protein n=1 Tax=Streptomyces piniterrae TaxID=2571125 RepID=UPI00145C6EA1
MARRVALCQGAGRTGEAVVCEVGAYSGAGGWGDDGGDGGDDGDEDGDEDGGYDGCT